MKLSRFILYLAILSFVLTVAAFSQDQEPTNAQKLQDFLIAMITEGGPAFLVSAWVASKWTKAKDLWMLLQTWAISIILAFGASIIGILDIPVGDVWKVLLQGFTNGLLANILYKLGILNSILRKLNISNGK